MDKILNHIKNCKRIVIKVGTTTLTHQNGKTNLRTMETLAKVISDLKNIGMEVILVSSGAIGIGVSNLGLKTRPNTVQGKQAAAAVGQCKLMYLYDKMFSEYGYMVAQVLLTKDVIDNSQRKSHAVDTLETLLDMNVIPIVNENDTVAIDEIECTFGENDTLSAIVSTLINADLLIILSDIEGLYDCDPKNNANAQLIHVVEEINDKVKSLAGGSGSLLGSGGMISKLNAGEIACNNGVNMIIASGSDPNILYKIFDGEQVGTLFLKKGQKINNYKHY